jgi:type IV pilus assembly protein PilQ
MTGTTREGIGGVRVRALAGVLLAGAICLGVFGAAPQRAGAADEIGATADAGSAAAQDRIPSVAAAKRLLGIEAERTDGGTVLRLRADGEITNAKTMVLENPTRLVLDLPGVRNAVGTKRIEIDSDQAARVRVGQHEDRVRVVVDGGSAMRPFEGHALLPRADGLWIGLGSEAARLGSDAAAVPIASAPARPSSAAAIATEASTPIAFESGAASVSPAPVSAAPAEDSAPLAIGTTASASPDQSPAIAPAAKSPAGATGTVRVHGVQYDAQADRDRLVIVQEGTASHTILRPDAETMVVSLQDAVLDAGATIRVTPQDPGPISLVTAIQMPGASVPEVRIAIARAAGAEPTITEQGDFLVLDFPRVGKKGEATASATADPGRVEQIANHYAAAATTRPTPAAPKTTNAPASAAGTSTDLLKEGGLIGGKNYTGRRISLDFKDVDISDVLRLIAEVSDLNVIAGDEVKGQVTIRLTDVPWDQALDVILLTKGLGFVLVGNVLRIAPQDVLKAEEASRLEERRAKEKLEDLVVKIQPVNYSSVTEIEAMVKKLLTARGSVNVDKRTNTLILKDIPGVVEEAVSLVKAVDTQTPQVLIESKIVEARLDFSRDLGAVWGIGSNPDNAISGDSAFKQPPNQTNGGTTFPFQQPNNVVVANPITSTANGLLNLGGYILNDRFNLTLQLQAAESNGEGKVISSPRVVTLDNREAKIEQGVSIPFQTFENGDAQLQFIDAVLSLLVTPHITADKSIIMKIQVTRNAPDASVPTPTGSPAIAKNEAKTETLVKNGQTLVLGGIYVLDRTETQQRVPYLYRIPIIGNAFKNDAVKDKRRELLIFVTPRIVEAETAQTN